MVEVDGVKITWTNRRNNYAAMQGALEFEVKGATNTQAAEKIKNVLEKYQKEAIIASRTAEDINRHKAMRVLWQVAPKEADVLAAMSPPPTYAEVMLTLEKRGIKQEALNDIKLKRITRGYYAYVWEGRAEHYKNIGADHVFVGVKRDGRDLLVNMGKKQEALKCSSIRHKTGISGGASVGTDMERGGGDSVFGRIVTKRAIRDKMEYNDAFKGGVYEIIYSPKVLERMDWYAYDGDNFGSTLPHTWDSRLGAEDFIYKMNSSYSSSNEIMFRSALAAEDAVGIVCETDQLRRNLIDNFKANGVTKINGKSISSFVTVSSQMKEFSK